MLLQRSLARLLACLLAIVACLVAALAVKDLSKELQDLRSTAVHLVLTVLQNKHQEGGYALQRVLVCVFDLTWTMRYKLSNSRRS